MVLGDWIGPDWKGREPVALMQLVLLHPAERCIEGPLRDLNGDTIRGWVFGVRGFFGEVDEDNSLSQPQEAFRV